ncbi:MAG TPA: superoxide dismutase family protein [Edaphobacter sp.]|jgi:Cu-Zn family superoxide dismutase|nr:superoxide dismutase family protein [Edaphobacter sp.]
MRLTVAALAVSLLAVPALAKSNGAVTVPLKTSTGQDAGTASFAPKGKAVVIRLNLKNLPPGQHAVHIHEHAVCEAPDFKTAGGHFNPDSKKHGTENPMGHHNGDLPQNVTADANGTAKATFRVDYLSLDPSASNSLFANGGTSIMVHEKADDMKTDPTGNAGNRIACGVITETK